MPDLYQTVCVWVVTAAGVAVVVTFAVYFIVVICRLIQEATRPAQAQVSMRPSTPRPPHFLRCTCGGMLGDVERMNLTDTGNFEVRSCLSCGTKTTQDNGGQP